MANGSTQLTKTGKTVAGAIGLGEALGYLIAIYIPDSFISDAYFAHGVGILFGLAALLLPYFGIGRPAPDDPITQFRKCVQATDKLMNDGLIMQSEYNAIRKSCLEKNKKDIVGA